MRSTILFLLAFFVTSPSYAGPDILLIMADDMDRRHFEHINPSVSTPNLEALRGFSHVFEASWTHARCAPSLGSILTGQRPHVHGHYFNQDRTGLGREPDPQTSFTLKLQQQGYRSFQAGKWWFGPQDQYGFEAWHDDRLRFARLNQLQLFNWMDTLEKEDDMFIWWAPMLPHTPHNEQQRHIDTVGPVVVPSYVDSSLSQEFIDEETELLAMTNWFDEELGQLFAKIQSLGRDNGLIIIFVIDNGWANGLVSKGSPYEMAYQCPIWVSAPGFRFNANLPQLVSGVDVYSTILNYAGIPSDRPESFDLGLYIRGESTGNRDCLAEFCYPALSFSVAHRQESYAVLVRDERFKLIAWTRDVTEGENGCLRIKHILTDFPERLMGDLEFYDLQGDPLELNDLYGSQCFVKDQERLLAKATDFWNNN